MFVMRHNLCHRLVTLNILANFLITFSVSQINEQNAEAQSLGYESYDSQCVQFTGHAI